LIKHFFAAFTRFHVVNMADAGTISNASIGIAGDAIGALS
jgi:hypothetical protein